jgi:transposase
MSTKKYVDKSEDTRFKIKKEIIALYKTGENQASVAAKTGVSLRTVKSVWAIYCKAVYGQRMTAKQAVLRDVARLSEIAEKRQPTEEAIYDKALENVMAREFHYIAGETVMIDSQSINTIEPTAEDLTEAEKYLWEKAINKALARDFIPLKSQHRGRASGVGRKLTKKQEMALFDHLLYDNTDKLWSFGTVADYIRQTFGIALTERSVATYLTRNKDGLPIMSHPRKDEVSSSYAVITRFCDLWLQTVRNDTRYKLIDENGTEYFSAKLPLCWTCEAELVREVFQKKPKTSRIIYAFIENKFYFKAYGSPITHEKFADFLTCLKDTISNDFLLIADPSVHWKYYAPNVHESWHDDPWFEYGHEGESFDKWREANPHSVVIFLPEVDENASLNTIDLAIKTCIAKNAIQTMTRKRQLDASFKRDDRTKNYFDMSRPKEYYYDNKLMKKSEIEEKISRILRLDNRRNHERELRSHQKHELSPTASPTNSEDSPPILPPEPIETP